MTANTVTIRTLTPISSPVDVATGVNPLSTEFKRALQSSIRFNQSGNDVHSSMLYQTLSDDETNLKLFEWRASEVDVVLHVFPNKLAVAELILSLPIADPQLEQNAQQQTQKILADIWPEFLHFLTVSIENSFSTLKLTLDKSLMSQSLVTHWVARTLEVDRIELKDPILCQVLRSWLSSTQNPDDAERIINNQLSYSMTWLNYVIVKDDDIQQRALIDAMILCQYTYTAQDSVNQAMADAIELAYADKHISHVEKQLSAARLSASMHLIAYHEQMKYLTRFKRKIMADVLQCWDFDNLVENCQRMINVCSHRLTEVDNRRRERSTALTDAILVSLSFIAMFELSMSLIQFSREMMSSPALDYNDEAASTILSFIADFDTDVVIGFGIALTVSLYFLYHKLKAK